MLDLYSKIHHLKKDSPVSSGKIILPELQILSLKREFLLDMNYPYEFNFRTR